MAEKASKYARENNEDSLDWTRCPYTGNPAASAQADLDLPSLQIFCVGPGPTVAVKTWTMKWFPNLDVFCSSFWCIPFSTDGWGMDGDGCYALWHLLEHPRDGHPEASSHSALALLHPATKGHPAHKSACGRGIRWGSDGKTGNLMLLDHGNSTLLHSESLITSLWSFERLA